MNPKDAAGRCKPGITAFPLAVLYEVVGVLALGAAKYGPYNWRKIKISDTIYVDAAVRHLTQYLAGEEIDTESGIPHLTHAIAGLVILRDAQLHGTVSDVRPVTHNLNLDGITQSILNINNTVSRVPEPALPVAIEGSSILLPSHHKHTVLLRSGETHTLFYNPHPGTRLNFQILHGPHTRRYGNDGRGSSRDRSYDIVAVLSDRYYWGPEGRLGADSVGCLVQLRSGSIARVTNYSPESPSITYWNPSSGTTGSTFLNGRHKDSTRHHPADIVRVLR